MKKILILFLTAIFIVSIAVTGISCRADETAPAEETTADETAPAEETTAEATTVEEEASAEPVTIDFLNFSANEGANVTILDLMKAVFENAHPNVTVNIETVGYDDYFTLLQTRVAAGEVADAFELNLDNFVVHRSEGALLPLNDLLASSPIDPDVMPQEGIDKFALDGSQYALPYSYSTVVLVYNKDIFDEAQIDYPTDSWTWADVDAAALKIKETLGDDYNGIIQPLQFWEFFKLVRQNGGSLFNDDGTAFTLNTPENLETLQHAVDRVLVSNISPTPQQFGTLDEWGLWKLGKTGMIVTGTWSFPTFTTETDFNWDIAVEPGNTKKATHYFVNVLSVSKDSANPQIAYEWIKFLSTSKEMASARIKVGWELPTAVYDDVLAEYSKTTPPENKQAVFESLKYSITQPLIIQLNKMADIIGQELGLALDGEKTPQQALDDAQALLEAGVTLQ